MQIIRITNGEGELIVTRRGIWGQFAFFRSALGTGRARPRLTLFLGFLPVLALANEATSDNETSQPSREAQMQPSEDVLITGKAVQDVAAAKTDVPWIESAQAISVVTAGMIKEQGIVRLHDALRGVAGISRSSTYGFYDAYTLRGYDAAYGSVYLDGLTTTSVAGTTNELAGLEQVEVIKGPAAALYGASPLGGIVNLVSKRPRPDSFLEASLSTGSYHFAEGNIDANAALSASGSLLGRVNLLYRDADDFVKYSAEQRLYVAPALTWNMGGATQLTLLGRYQRDRDNPWAPLTAYGTVLPSAHGRLTPKFSVNRDGADRGFVNQDRKQVGYVFDHRFNDATSFTQTLRHTETKTHWNNWIFSDEFVDSEFIDGVQQGHVLGLSIYGPFRQVDHDFGVDSRLNIKVATGLLRHTVLAGIDYKRNTNRFADGGGNFDYTVNTLDILAPRSTLPLVHDPASAYSGSGKSDQTGYYLQDHIGFLDRWFLTVGGRWDHVKTDGQKDHAFSPNVGLNYLIAPTVSLYANWARPFTPQFGWVLDIDGNQLPPETGRNIEAGIKWDSAEGRLSGLASIFQLTRKNVATEDPSNPFFYVVTGEQRSRGLEIEGRWSPSRAWTTSLAYTYLDAQIARRQHAASRHAPQQHSQAQCLPLWKIRSAAGSPCGSRTESRSALQQLQEQQSLPGRYRW